MFALTVSSLDGTSVALEVGPDVTVASLKDKLLLAREVPRFHEVKLLYGGQELKDGTPIELELQAVVTVSPAEVVAKIAEAARRVTSIAARRVTSIFQALYLQDADLDEFISVLDGIQYKEAIERLGELDNLAPSLCEQLFDAMHDICVMCDKVYQGYNGKKPREIQIFAANTGDNLARSFGRLCGNPMAYIRPLTECLEDGDSSMLCALAEIALRDAEMLHDHSATICVKAKRVVESAPTGQTASPSIQKPLYESKMKAEAACQLLSELGWSRFKEILQQAADKDFPAAAVALERIAAHEIEAAAHCSDTPVHLARNPGFQSEDTAMELLRGEHEQEVKLELALRMDEAQISEIENAELAEAMLRNIEENSPQIPEVENAELTEAVLRNVANGGNRKTSHPSSSGLAEVHEDAGLTDVDGGKRKMSHRQRRRRANAWKKIPATASSASEKNP